MTKQTRECRIVVSKDGPCIVPGDVPISIQIIAPNHDGESWEWKQGQTFDVKPTTPFAAADTPIQNHSVTVLTRESASMAAKQLAALPSLGRRKQSTGRPLS